MAYVPERWDVIWLNFSPQVGREQAGRRPALTLTPAKYNRIAGLGIFCPFTNQVKGYPFEVLIPGGLPVTGVILADQARNLDWRLRKAEYICKLPKTAAKEVLEKLTILLEI